MVYYWTLWELLADTRRQFRACGQFRAKDDGGAKAILRAEWSKFEGCKLIRCIREGHIVFEFTDFRERFGKEYPVHEVGSKFM
jgi:hypothetical protein